MSQSEADSFLRFGKMLVSARSVFLDEKHKIIDDKQSDGKMHCVERFTYTVMQPSLKYGIFFFFTNHGLMGRFGFKSKDYKRRFLCPEPDCYAVRRVYGMANHLHVKHKIAVSECGKVILALMNDTRPIPKNSFIFKQSCIKLFDDIVYFFRN